MLRAAAEAAVCGAFLLALALPLPSQAGAEAERYRCVWEGGETEEGYASVYSAFYEAQPDAVVLARGGMFGTIDPGDAYRVAFQTLDAGSMSDLLTLDTAGLSRLGRFALYRGFKDVCYYAGESFRYDGSKVVRAADGKADRLVLLEGELPSGFLATYGVSSLDVRAAASVTSRDLVGSAVSSLRAQSPYRAEGDCLLLGTAGGVRLVAALPRTELALPATDFADEGALLACRGLVSLTLPYLGSAASGTGESVRGELAHLFSTGETYEVPDTLRKVRVTGGKIVSRAFYACYGLEEIDACGVDAALIADDAFSGLLRLRVLHTPREGAPGEGFAAERAPCGCFVYRREEFV